MAWSLFARFVVATDWVVGTFGELSGRHPLFILVVYAPAIAALEIEERLTAPTRREGS